MRAARIHGLRDLRVDELPAPEPRADEALVRVRAVGICRSDLHLYETGAIGSIDSPQPIVPGHEAGGVVETGVPGLPAGTRVAIEPTRPCGRCDWCARGDYHICPHLRFLSLPPTDGAMAEYVAAEPQYLLPVPDGLPDHLVAVVEPLAVALHALGLAPQVPERVVVLGAGAIGLLLVQVARLGGARQVLVTEPLAERRRLAGSLGATASFDPADPEMMRQVWAGTGGEGAPLVLEAAGAADTVEQAVRLAAPGGRVVVAGIPEQDRAAFPASTARRRELTVVFARRYRHRFAEAIELLANGRVDAGPLVTHRYPLAEAPAAFAAAAARQAGVRTVVEL